MKSFTIRTVCWSSCLNLLILATCGCRGAANRTQYVDAPLMYETAPPVAQAQFAPAPGIAQVDQSDAERPLPVPPSQD